MIATSSSSYSLYSRFEKPILQRRRRRGPRSQLAVLRRSFRSHAAPADGIRGESRVNASAPISQEINFSIYCLNIRCLLSKLAEIQFHIERLQPHVIVLQETWLDTSIESVNIPNYILVSRRDRSEHSNRGGIAAFAQSDLRNMVCIAKSIHAERAWHLLHTDVGSIAIVNWYRPGSSPITHIISFREEYAEHAHEFQSIIVAGDLNIRHRS